MTVMPGKLFLVLLIYDVVDAVEHIGHHLHNAVHRRKRIGGNADHAAGAVLDDKEADRLDLDARAVAAGKGNALAAGRAAGADAGASEAPKDEKVVDADFEEVK